MTELRKDDLISFSDQVLNLYESGISEEQISAFAFSEVISDWLDAINESELGKELSRRLANFKFPIK
ncbi:hypothetical protein KW795_03090 [Candidatus Microgenomates bacterium]|nr:hypothetical protein [Candidatus Microgenomates bacterium]